jgi:hypothetical protein
MRSCLLSWRGLAGRRDIKRVHKPPRHSHKPDTQCVGVSVKENGAEFAAQAKFRSLQHFFEVVEAPASDAIDHEVDVIKNEVLQGVIVATHHHAHPPLVKGETEFVLGP